MNKIQCGFSRLDITPPLGSFVAGYFTRRVADGVLDPLEVQAIAVGDGEKTVLLLAFDFINVMEDVSTELRNLVEEELGVPAGCVFLHALHQHTSVRIGSKPHIPNGDRVRDPAYLAMLYRKVIDVCRMAMDDMSPAEMLTASGETAVPIAFIRRYRMRDGSVRTNPGVGNPDVVEPMGQADNTVRLVRFRREKGDVALVNFSTHPDVIGGNKFSADWPGFVRRRVEAALDGVHCAVFNGAQGDSNHIDVFCTNKKKGYAHSEFMGSVITDTVLSLWEQATPRPTGQPYGRVEILYVPTNTRDADREEELRQMRQEANEGKRTLTGAQKALIGRVLSLKNETIYQKVPVSFVAFGDVALTGYGGEPFTDYATAFRRVRPDLFLITCCCTGGGQGYLPDEAAFDEGGYEACNSRFDSCVASLLQNKSREMLTEYRALIEK